jgi:hypothetical protein
MKYFYLSVLAVFLSACSSNSNTAEGWAKKFCNCSKEMSESVVKLKSNQILLKEFEQIKIKQQKCMGPSDPRSAMTETEVAAFDSVFYKTLFIECPEIARNYGFVE